MTQTTNNNANEKAATDDSLEEEGRMSFLQHLGELRDRLRSAVIATFCGFLVAYTFKEELFVILLRPLNNVWQEKMASDPSIGEFQMAFRSLIEPFWTYFGIALWAGIFIASPFIFYQVWKFIAPGLYKKERRYGMLFSIVSGICFLSGALFCYFLVLEPVFGFLLGYADANLANMNRLGAEYNLLDGGSVAVKPELFMQEYLSFARKLLIGFGLVFELPLIIIVLSLLGVVTHRSLWKFNRWWVLLSFVLAALLTPPDPASQLLMAGPLVFLYNVSILFAFFITKRREAKNRAPN